AGRWPFGRLAVLSVYCGAGGGSKKRRCPSAGRAANRLMLELSKTFAREFMGRKSHKPPLTLVSEPVSIAAEPPATLREAGRNLWQSVMREYAIADAGGLALLEQACASADRAAECAAIIAEQGAVISTKYGLKDHPLLRHEATARGLVGRLLARLGLDVEPLRPAAGRPGVGFGW